MAGQAGLAEQGRVWEAVPSVRGGGMPLLARGGVCAVLAQSFHFDRCALHGKVFFAANIFEHVQHTWCICNFGHATAVPADQELGAVQAGIRVVVGVVVRMVM